MEVPEDSGKEEYWVTVGRLVEQSPLLRDIWFWFKRGDVTLYDGLCSLVQSTQNKTRRESNQPPKLEGR